MACSPGLRRACQLDPPSIPWTLGGGSAEVLRRECLASCGSAEFMLQLTNPVMDAALHSIPDLSSCLGSAAQPARLFSPGKYAVQVLGTRLEASSVSPTPSSLVSPQAQAQPQPHAQRQTQSLGSWQRLEGISPLSR
ncbi:hypothetical protein JHW43_001048 [Diplocarpon mali]|nr:hypothetical protein JHW43_001048 [Diplocarpon mali]